MPDLTTLSRQQDFLLSLGRRLYDWVRVPGDAADVYVEGECLLPPGLQERLRPLPMRVVDVLLARWIMVRGAVTPTACPLLVTPAQWHLSGQWTGRDIILKSGKIGFTTYIGLRFYLHALTHPGTTALLIAHEDKATQDIFSQVEFAHRHLPESLAPLKDNLLKLGRSSTRELYWPELNSRYFVETAGDKLAAVGQNLQLLHGSEVAKWQRGDPKQVLANVLSHMIGERTQVVLESRPFGDYGEFYMRYWEARRGESDFTAHFYPWWWALWHRMDVEEGFMSSVDEEQLRTRYKAWRVSPSLYRCGLPPELPLDMVKWRRTQQIELREKAPQEFAEDEIQCFLGSGDCPFSASAMDIILKAGHEPVEVFSGSGKPAEENGLWIYTPPVEGEDYILFGDPAGGLAKSRTALQVINQRTGEQVAEYAGRQDYEATAAMMVMLGRRYNEALIAYENNMGKAAATITLRLSSYPRLYWHASKPKQLGWPTERNRDDMIDWYGKILSESPELFKSRRLVQETKTCERRQNRIQAKQGHTDDLVLSMAGAQSVRRAAGRYTGPVAQSLIATPEVEAKPGEPTAMKGYGPDSWWQRVR